MINKSVDYVVHSIDEECYQKLKVSLPGPNTEYSKFLVTTFTTKCEMIVLDETDFITINYWEIANDGHIVKSEYITYNIDREYTNMDLDNFPLILNAIIEKNNKYKLSIQKNPTNRFIFVCDTTFDIFHVSHRLSLILGLYNPKTHFSKFYDPDTSLKSYVQINSVGYPLLTPVLYLLSNLGEQCYRTMNDGKVQGVKVVMKINNSFNAGQPIIHPNAEFETIIKSSDLSNIEFTLVDAFMKEVKLLSPMYLTIHVDAIPDEYLMPDYTIPEIVDYENYGPPSQIIGKQTGEKQNVEEETPAEIINVMNEVEKMNKVESVVEPVLDSKPKKKRGKNMSVKDLLKEEEEKNKIPKINNAFMPLFMGMNQESYQTQEEINAFNEGIDAVIQQLKEESRVSTGTEIVNNVEVQKV